MRNKINQMLTEIFNDKKIKINLKNTIRKKEIDKPENQKQTLNKFEKMKQFGNKIIIENNKRNQSLNKSISEKNNKDKKNDKIISYVYTKKKVEPASIINKQKSPMREKERNKNYITKENINKNANNIKTINLNENINYINDTNRNNYNIDYIDYNIKNINKRVTNYSISRKTIKKCFCPFHVNKRRNLIKEKHESEFSIISSKKNNIFILENNIKIYIPKKDKETKLVKKRLFQLNFSSIKKNKIFEISKNLQINFNPIKKKKCFDSVLTQDKNGNFNFSPIKTNKSFDSDLTQDTSENLNFSIISSDLEIKDLIRLPDTPKGLYNFALNCYMNSLLQCFYHIKGLRTKFIDPSKFTPETQKVSYALSEVMKELTYGEKNYYSPNNFKNTLGNINTLFSGKKGADVSDLYRTIVDSIINEMPYEYPEDEDEEDNGNNTNQKQYYLNAKKEVDENNPINQELNYFFETIYDCPKGVKCYAMQNDTSIMFELLKISKWANCKQLDLYKCFDFNYRIMPKNEFYCSNCQCTHINNSQDKIVSLPKILTLILNRGKGKQFYDKVIFYERINIKQYVDNTFIEAKDRKYNYKLIGVSTHSGVSSGTAGHYIAFCYREIENKYFCFNDTSVRQVKFEDLSYGEPYILFYEQTNE